jgi:glycosyltransferase involved in cell wall biosynthesis
MIPLICHSSERRGSLGFQLGSAHATYRFVEDSFVRLLDQAGYSTAYVQEPQNYKHAKSYRELLNCAPKDVIHIAFRSTENIRPMQGAKNVCHFAWEFDVMRDSGLVNESILSNQVHMLSMMDEIWVGCEFTRQILEKYGLHKTFVVPKPVVGEILPERLGFKEALAHIGAVPTVPLLLESGLDRETHAELVAPFIAPLSDRLVIRGQAEGTGGRIFLAVVNPGDLRKNLLNLIEGFQIACNALQSKDTLIIKLLVPNKGDFRVNGLFDYVRPRLNSPLAYNDNKISFILDFLSDQQLGALFSLADYYLCASHCEGFNIPLLQAMSFGAVPVSTRNTAMVDYIDGDNAILIKERRFLSPIPGMAGDVAGVPYFVDHASRFDIAEACGSAMRQGESDREAMAENARQTVFRQYGEQEVLRRIEERFSVLARSDVRA